ncbi:hypothetical protein FRC09_013071, partial [Ceratobasidium sp. 395]
MFPPEIHLMILESYLGDKSLYNQDTSFKRLSISDWIGLSLVCRAWKDRIYSIAFHHLLVEQRYLSELDKAYKTLASAVDNCGSYNAARPAFSFVRTLTIYLPHPVSRLLETMFVLQQAPNLHKLSLDICLQPNTERICTSEAPHLQHVTCFGLRFGYVPDGYYISWKAKDIQWILSCVPNVKHLLLDIPRQLGETDASHTTISFPYAASIQSNCWVEWLLSSEVRFPNLRFLEVSGDPSSDNLRFLDRHSTSLESLTLGDVNHGWTELIPTFRPMRHLALSYLYNFPWQLTQLPYLCHFEFLWLGGDQDSSAEILEFLGSCGSLQVITYHSQLRISFLEGFCRQKDMQCIWRQ